MTIFISMPMHGMSHKAVEMFMNNAIKNAKRRFGDGVIFVNALDTDPPSTGVYEHPRLYYLGNAIVKMAECDGVYFCNDWYAAPGCQIEYEVAIRYGLDCYFE